MAVTILQQAVMADGYDVLVDADGAHIVVHYAARPMNVDAAIADWYANLVNTTYEIIGE